MNGHRLPRWFRWTFAAVFAGVFSVYFLVRDGGLGEVLAQSLLERVAAESAPLLRLQALGAGARGEPKNGSYVVNGMRIQYATMAAPVGIGESLRRFAEAFAKTGYKWKLLQIQGRPMLVAIHPETKMLLTVRPDRDDRGRPTVRLSQQNLSQLDPAFRAEIPGVPVLPGATGRLLVTSNDGQPARSLTYTAPASGEWVSEYYLRELAQSGWRLIPPPAALPPGVLTTLFFERPGAQLSIVVVPDDESSESLVLVTLTGTRDREEG